MAHAVATQAIAILYHFRSTPHLNGMHTAFGRVIEGIELLATCNDARPNTHRTRRSRPYSEGEVLRDRGHEYNSSGYRNAECLLLRWHLSRHLLSRTSVICLTRIRSVWRILAVDSVLFRKKALYFPKCPLRKEIGRLSSSLLILNLNSNRRLFG